MMGETTTLSSNLIGTVLLGRYRVVRELAKGGMGVVYLARAEGAVGFVKPVVIKLVLPEHASDRRFVQMFAREAQILANLRHASIVDVIEFGEENGAYIMVLEYVRGYHVGQWARYLRLKGRTVPANIAIQIIIDVLEALDHAHSMVHPDGASMHIVHRDISPSNILLDEDGRARLLDFGVARMRGGDYDYQTQVKGFVGKLIYSAPEVFADGDATPSSDCYSCAVVLHEILLGRNTFRADNQAKTLHRVLNHPAEALEPIVPGLPKGLDAVLLKALAKSPEERFGSARELAAALRTLQDQPENDLRAQLAGLLKHDFGREMADLLGIETLSDRDDAWRRTSRATSSAPPPPLDVNDSTYVHDPTTNSFSENSFTDPSTGGPTQPPTAVEVRRGPSTLRPVADLPTFRPPAPSQVARLAPHAKGSRLSSLLAVSTLLVGAALFVFVLTQRSAPVRPQIRVVSSPRSTVPTVTPVAPERPATPGAGENARSKPSHQEAGRGPRQGGEASTEQRQLTRAVRRQQPAITACFVEHAKGLSAVPAMQLDYELAADGGISRLRVLPAALAQSPLGLCLHAAGSAARFPPLGKPVSFTIPLMTSAASEPPGK